MLISMSELSTETIEQTVAAASANEELCATSPLSLIAEPPTRDKINRLEEELSKLPQVDCPVRNIFAPGIYAREMTIPAGVTLTGAVHKTEHLCIISAGRIVVSMDDGMREITAPCTFVSKPGIKRVGHALEDTVWTTIHATEETDIDKLVEELTESTAQELLGGSQNRQLLNARKELS